MPQIATVDPKTVELLPEKRELLREPYLDAMKQLAENKQPVQFTPGEGETLRKIRVNVTRAANEIELEITSRETRDGSLVVYCKPVSNRKARQAKNESENGAETEEATAE